MCLCIYKGGATYQKQQDHLPGTKDYKHVAPPNPTTSSHSARYLCLIEVLRCKGTFEPRFDVEHATAWLAWAHGARWLVRMLFESYALATAHGDTRIPLPSGIPEVCELIEHLDCVFLNLRSEQNEAPLLYATIPWSPDQLQKEQAAAEEARPPPPPSYNDPPLRLSSLRSSTDNWDRVLAATDRSLDVLRLELGHLHRGLAEARIDQLSVMREVVSISGRLEDICDARDIPPPLELIRD
ncbi:uncharacterized protein C8Q71DRAFT_845548 [Rhodofomes roseus]|uniref:Uncharacterized protein n=1 Tax=Rhodofomes roseus TaxID=34475 RepID=A0ABQ8KTK5_9APHY|nr:uncharacterized protein C8Q71DRAFT_845548 [Rhodofomes roseus]KAH9841333.1 hypothetical protein C8Q71DRAFT_845548 [Rhodofomes roseus]